jgi:hypothetical protein
MEEKLMDKTKLRIVSKACLLLVIMGFFMPVTCNLNGFDLAKRLTSSEAGPDMSCLGWALCALFAFACLGVILLFVLASKKNPHIGWDWFATLGAALSAAAALVKKPTDKISGFQAGAYVILCGLALSLIILIMASGAKKSPEEKTAAGENGGGEA